VKNNFLAGRSFVDDADLQTQCTDWQAADNRTRPSQATDVTRMSTPGNPGPPNYRRG
jgi:hypothetical protein